MSVEMELVGVKIQMPTNSPVLILRESEGARRLVPIFIGGPEAHAIDLAVSGEEVSRPMTHDLFIDVIDGLDATLQSVVIEKLKNGTFYANLMLADKDKNVLVFSSRASDAVALAVRTACPILAEESVVELAGIVETGETADLGEEEMVEELRRFLDEVKPEDFST